MQTVGDTLKFIRKSKNLTQQEACTDALSRSNYQKIENNKIMPSMDRFIQLLLNFNMTLEEFEFVKRDFTPSPKENILYLYSKIITSSETDILLNVISKCDAYLENHTDTFISDIKASLEGILLVEKEHDFELARQKVTYIWDRLSESDELFWNDILILRNIFFIFENETAQHIVNRLIKQLKKYRFLHPTLSIEISLHVNRATYLILDEKYELALHYIEQSIKISKQNHYYLQFCMAIAKKGIVLYKLGQKQDGKRFMQRALRVAKFLEEERILNGIKNEIDYFLHDDNLTLNECTKIDI
ncbi:helix-turn-helix domain-containing protein [Listeria cossartiae subsp. cayugensis]|uniref:Helix-turn-helix domain-containing protein n=1 Tax=Listeria cossartiae subsp. cayugensis TaxID=2713505 RepID=A0ABU2IQR7_9LIST|nr:helix-turn-helix domain-containing protein [Listeria cossartiae]MDT0050607.1 helix-turn-helix domain-containing protein [Listeria cossartiae subsp. cayugensis]MDT0067109.1 helix-turn-helix domain-containing protein [Listeria cossartiae subsp. cayugensis]MDT0080906.1 helix-turn-helix domain-containing protein [Listeria cossartiae subsp. cayugensis]MDT0083571.1 helix-turn-helix domain-containing protein [Listeria cossartiae subsp. cayugensis]MDT0089342.1 helix-turn-helix domain-containing pro